MDKSSHGRGKSKRQLLLLGLVFIVPILLAKFALTIGFKGEVKTHGGELLSLNKTYQQIIGNEVDGNNKQWRVVYFSHGDCNERCLNGLYHIQQTYKALGRLQERVSIDLLNSQGSQVSRPTENLSMTLFSHVVVESLNMPMLEHKVVIVDPMGNLVMSYEFDGKAEQNLVIAHDMLLDIKQLLKLSRIG